MLFYGYSSCSLIVFYYSIVIVLRCNSILLEYSVTLKLQQIVDSYTYIYLQQLMILIQCHLILLWGACEPGLVFAGAPPKAHKNFKARALTSQRIASLYHTKGSSSLLHDELPGLTPEIPRVARMALRSL